MRLKERAHWFARAGPMMWSLGCIMYADAYFFGFERFQVILGGLMWATGVAQWSLENTVPKWKVEGKACD